MIRALIVDHDRRARKALRKVLGAENGIEVVGECADGLEAVHAVTALNPDVLFLDAQLPSLSAFEVLSLLDRSPLVMFMMEFDDRLMWLFERHELDYLIKPYYKDRLLGWLRGIARHPRRIEAAVLASMLRPRVLGRIAVRDGKDRIHVVPSGAIEFIEARGGMVRIVCRHETIWTRQSIDRLAEGLDPRCFVRIDRAYLLNVNCVTRRRVRVRGNDVAIRVHRSTLPVSHIAAPPVWAAFKGAVRAIVERRQLLPQHA